MEKRKCAKRRCKNPVDDGDLYCQECISTSLERPKCAIRGCSRTPQPDKLFCSSCSQLGADLDSPRTTCDNLPAVRDERGAALIVVLLVVLVLMAAGLVGLHLSSQGTMMASNLNLAEQARISAEAGLERGRAVLLSSPGVRVSDLLAGTNDPDDQVPNDPSGCDGSSRGAVLVDPTTHSKVKDVPYPSIDRSVLPPSAGTVTSSMGHYTVYVRQDQGDCRMGNYTCDSYPDSGSCTPPQGSPAPNGYVVVRSEAVASDGKSRAVVEMTVRLVLPPSTGGSSGSGGEGTGGSSGSGGVGGIGGGVGGSSQGTGGSGTGGSTTCVPVPCLPYAVLAVAPCSGSVPGCITINNSTVVDGYDSSYGPSGPGNQSNASVGMRCSSGASGSCPKNCPSGCITGSINYGQNVNLSTSTLPLPPHSANNDHLSAPPSSTATTTPPPDATYYEYLDLNAGGTVTLRAGRYVVEHLNSTANSTLFIDDTDGPVFLWVEQNLSPNCTVTVKSGRPSSFWLVYVGTDDVNNNSNNFFTGVIFAPASRVNLNYVVNGAVVGGQVTLNSLSKVHFDSNLTCP
jgi:uncharacterized membrane protein YgcG